MFETKHIQKYLEEITPLSFCEAVGTLSQYPDTVRQDVNLLQAVFAKLLLPGAQKADGLCWKNLDRKIEILSCFREHFDMLYRSLQVVFRDGYYSFAEDLYDTRIVYIFVYLKKRKEIEHLYNILTEHARSFDSVFYDFWGNGFHFAPEQPWAFFRRGWNLSEDEFYQATLFDESGEVIEVREDD